MKAENEAQQHDFLTRIDDLCGLFAERAAAVDTGGPSNELIRDNIGRLGQIGFYGASISPTSCGLGLPDDVKREAMERLSAACGVTAFSQQQFHAGAGFVNGASSAALKTDVLPKLCSGEILCGVAFAHLRRPGRPAVAARRVDGGFVIAGNAPWVSVWSLLDSFILGATVEETGEMIFAYVDRRSAGDKLKASEPMALAVMGSSDTVSLKMHDLFLEDGVILQLRDADHLKRGDYCGITGHVTLPLGCARGSAGYLRTLDKPAAKAAADRLAAEIKICRAESAYWNGSRADEAGYRENALRVRAGSVNIALRAAETAIAASGGRAHLLTHPAQRRLREAGFYATMALTADTQSALMETFTHAC